MRYDWSMLLESSVDCVHVPEHCYYLWKHWIVFWYFYFWLFFWAVLHSVRLRSKVKQLNKHSNHCFVSAWRNKNVKSDLSEMPKFWVCCVKAGLLMWRYDAVDKRCYSKCDRHLQNHKGNFCFHSQNKNDRGYRSDVTFLVYRNLALSKKLAVIYKPGTSFNALKLEHISIFSTKCHQCNVNYQVSSVQRKLPSVNSAQTCCHFCCVVHPFKINANKLCPNAVIRCPNVVSQSFSLQSLSLSETRKDNFCSFQPLQKPPQEAKNKISGVQSMKP